MTRWCITGTSDFRKEQDHEEVAIFDPRMDGAFRSPAVGELPGAERRPRRPRAAHARLGNEASRVQPPALIGFQLPASTNAEAAMWLPLLLRAALLRLKPRTASRPAADAACLRSR